MAVVVRVRPREPADEAEVLDAVRLLGRGDRVLHRERADTDEAAGLGRAPLRHPVVVDAARPHRELGVDDRAELEAQPRVHDADVDALAVEDLHALVRVEAGRVQALVVAALPEVVVGLTGVAESDESAVGRHAVLDQALVVTRRLVPPQADAAVGQP